MADAENMLAVLNYLHISTLSILLKKPGDAKIPKAVGLNRKRTGSGHRLSKAASLPVVVKAIE
jgi:hypothetical protein